MRPPNLLGMFSVEDPKGTLYSGIRDGDWIHRGGHCGPERYELFVQPRKSNKQRAPGVAWF